MLSLYLLILYVPCISNILSSSFHVTCCNLPKSENWISMVHISLLHLHNIENHRCIYIIIDTDINRGFFGNRINRFVNLMKNQEYISYAHGHVNECKPQITYYFQDYNSEQMLKWRSYAQSFWEFWWCDLEENSE